MEAKLKTTVIKLNRDNVYIHFCQLKKSIKFGFKALFKNEQKELFYDVYGFSKTLLQLNNLRDHI
jgi:hypothetical protein